MVARFSSAFSFALCRRSRLALFLKAMRALRCGRPAPIPAWRGARVDTSRQIYLGMAISNALVAWAVHWFAQTNGFADVTSGVGTIVVGLAAVIIGQTLLRRPRHSDRAHRLRARVDPLPHRIQVALSTDTLGLQASDLNFVDRACW